MQTPSSSTRWWFESLDRSRRQQGAEMDRLGYGPCESPFRTMLKTPGMRLRVYGGDAQAKRIALIVPAPIKRHYIWDLMPERSVVQRALRAGMQVYLIEWTDPAEAPTALGLEDYADTLIDRCMQAIRSTHPEQKIFLLSHSLGGTFAAIYAALHPQQLAGLVLLEAPLHFPPDSGCFGPLVANSPPAGELARSLDTVPGSVLNLASMIASPATFGSARYADFFASLMSSEKIRSHCLVERWTLDEMPMSRKLFEQVVDQLYREDRFMRRELHIADRVTGPQEIVAPLLSVYSPRSVVIPPASVIAFHEVAASRSKRLLPYDGDTGVALEHVGVLVGENAHRRLWPDIFGWIGEIDATRH
ncbi:MAG: alpha/beta fold hydrolase [Noviherbaspirillum sp.]